MDLFDTLQTLLVFCILDESQSGNNSTEGKEKYETSNCKSHRRVHVILHEHELEVADKSVKKRSEH